MMIQSSRSKCLLKILRSTKKMNVFAFDKLFKSQCHGFFLHSLLAFRENANHLPFFQMMSGNNIQRENSSFIVCRKLLQKPHIFRPIKNDMQNVCLRVQFFFFNEFLFSFISCVWYLKCFSSYFMDDFFLLIFFSIYRKNAILRFTSFLVDLDNT